MATLIEWTHLNEIYKGETLNPLKGCQKISPACTNCYAIATTINLQQRFGVSKYNQVVDSKKNNWNSNIFFDPETAIKILSLNSAPKAIFLCSLSDFCLGAQSDLINVDKPSLSDSWYKDWGKNYEPIGFGYGEDRVVMDFYRDVLIASIIYSHQYNKENKYLVLTKRPEVLKSYLEDLTSNPRKAVNRLSYAMVWMLNRNLELNTLPKKTKEVFIKLEHKDKLNFFGIRWDKITPALNKAFWFGTTIESQDYIDRLSILQSITFGQKKFVSAEPLLSPLSFLPDHRFDWLVIGGESGNRVRKTKLDDIIKTINSAKQSCNPPAIFVKQLGKELAKDYPGQNKKGGNFDCMPSALQIREFPGF